MSWKCIQDIRRWADEDIGSVGRDVLRRQAHRLADECEKRLDSQEAFYKEKINAMAGVSAGAAARNARDGKVGIGNFRGKESETGEVEKLQAENDRLRKGIRHLIQYLKESEAMFYCDYRHDGAADMAVQRLGNIRCDADSILCPDEYEEWYKTIQGRIERNDAHFDERMSELDRKIAEEDARSTFGRSVRGLFAGDAMPVERRGWPGGGRKENGRQERK